MVRRILPTRVLWAPAIVLAIPLLLIGGAAGRPGGRAAVVVQHGNLGTLVECVPLRGGAPDGIGLLARSHFEYRAARYPDGTAICWLDGEGCKTTDPKNCFCTPLSGASDAWGYWVQDKGDSTYRFSSTYPSGRRVKDGSVDYWSFGPYGMPPVSTSSFADICHR